MYSISRRVLISWTTTPAWNTGQHEIIKCDLIFQTTTSVCNTDQYECANGTYTLTAEPEICIATTQVCNGYRDCHTGQISTAFAYWNGYCGIFIIFSALLVLEDVILSIPGNIVTEMSSCPIKCTMEYVTLVATFCTLLERSAASDRSQKLGHGLRRVK